MKSIRLPRFRFACLSPRALMRCPLPRWAGPAPRAARRDPERRRIAWKGLAEIAARERRWFDYRVRPKEGARTWCKTSGGKELSSRSAKWVGRGFAGEGTLYGRREWILHDKTRRGRRGSGSVASAVRRSKRCGELASGEKKVSRIGASRSRGSFTHLALSRPAAPRAAARRQRSGRRRRRRGAAARPAARMPRQQYRGTTYPHELANGAELNIATSPSSRSPRRKFLATVIAAADKSHRSLRT